MLIADIFALLSKFAVVDFIIDVVLIVIAVSIKYTPYHSDFTPFIQSDITNPAATETISYGSLCIVTFGVGSIVIIFFWLLVYFDINVLKAIASYVFGIASTMLVCAVVGKIVGRPRPDTATICGTDGSFGTCVGFLSQSQLVNQFTSFPSTEAAEAMAAAIFLCFYIGELIPYYNNITSLLMCSPIFFGIFVFASCIWDRKNHVDDAVAGMVIGSILGFIAFHTFKKVIKQKKIERRPAAVTETSALPMPRYN